MLLVFPGCDQPFSFTPFDAGPPAVTNITRTNLERIKALQVSNDVIRVALLSDTHYHFDDTADALNQISRDTSISFTIVTGDITENGLKKEFELFHSMMEKSHKPYLTVIGNHDHLSNGGLVYESMFGAPNYSFELGGVKFVMWDNVLWESNRTPDWQWFMNEVQINQDDVGESGSARVVIPFSHIPPIDGQLADSASVYHQLMVENQIALSVHGHKHEYMNEQLYDERVRYVTVGSPQKRSYAVLTISGNEVWVERVRF
jgi:3',5'-cyclic-AMP phosphodiesterase